MVTRIDLKNLDPRDARDVCFAFLSEYLGIPEGLSENESNPTALWAEIWRLRAQAKGPEKYETWRDCAIAERQRRVSAERALETLRALLKHELDHAELNGTKLPPLFGTTLEITAIPLRNIQACLLNPDTVACTCNAAANTPHSEACPVTAAGRAAFAASGESAQGGIDPITLGMAAAASESSAPLREWIETVVKDESWVPPDAELVESLKRKIPGLPDFSTREGVEARIKQLMIDVGLPNSQSLAQAFKQFEMELDLFHNGSPWDRPARMSVAEAYVMTTKFLGLPLKMLEGDEGIPEKGDIWQHHSGDFYVALAVTSKPDPGEKEVKFPRTVFYQGPDGRCWARTLESWKESFKFFLKSQTIEGELRKGDMRTSSDGTLWTCTDPDINRWVGTGQMVAPPSTTADVDKMVEDISADLVRETERIIRQYDEWKRTGISTASHGGSHDTHFAVILKNHLKPVLS